MTVAPGTLDRVPGATMSTMSLSPADVRALLARHDIRPSRALGQNFLVDPNTARRIVRLAGVEPGDRVLEIGPGIGSLTVELGPVTAFGIGQERDGSFRFVASAGRVVAGPLLKIGNTTSRVDFGCDPGQWADEWSSTGISSLCSTRSSTTSTTSTSSRATR